MINVIHNERGCRNVVVKPVAQFRDVHICWGYVYKNRRDFAAKSRFLCMATSRGFSAAVFDMILNKRRAGTSLQQTS